MTLHAPETALAALGFTDTEAAIYCELLRASPSTGYRLAQAIGKAAANTYQALAALTQKGAVLVDEGDAKAYRAVPPAELLAALGRGFETRRAEAQSALEALYAPPADDRIYQVKTPAQVYERARAMIEGASEIVLFDLFPGPFETLRLPLAHAARKAVVAGLAYEEVADAGFAVVRSAAAAFARERWPGLQLSLVVDGREYLEVLLSADGSSVRHGVWSDSVYLTCMKHSGLAAEIQLSAATRGEAEDLRGISLLRSYPAGLRALVGPRDASEENAA
ncbi:MAG: TrmB family transcriptional regulator [Proteobacteria bacterium]|nr:TrmB family transcriptional regulator [Pseudomonadota bacterium]